MGSTIRSLSSSSRLTTSLLGPACRAAARSELSLPPIFFASFFACMEGRGALACTSILRAASSTEQSQIQQMTGAAGNTRWQRADSAGYMPTWTLIWFDLTYETILTFPCTALGLLAFSMEPNYERTKAVMSTAGATQANPVKRLLNRVFVGCLRLLW